MEIKESLIFSRIQMSDINIEDLAKVFNAHKYSDKAGIGFTYVHIEDNSIVTKILVRNPSYIQNYNIRENIFEKNIVYIYDETDLILDYQLGLIYSTSSATKFNKAKSLLRNCLKSKVTFKNIECSIEKMIEKIALLEWNPLIVDLSIKKFVYKEGAIGRFTVHLDNPQIGEELLKQYSGNISRITLSVDSNAFSVFYLSIASQSSFTIKCQESEFWPIVNIIKQKL